MRKILTAMTLAVAMGLSGLTYADQAIVDALKAEGLVLNEAAEQSLLEAQTDEELLEAITSLINSLNSDDALSAVHRAVSSAHPDLREGVVVALSQRDSALRTIAASNERRSSIPDSVGGGGSGSPD